MVQNVLEETYMILVAYIFSKKTSWGWKLFSSKCSNFSQTFLYIYSDILPLMNKFTHLPFPYHLFWNISFIWYARHCIT